MSKAEGDKMSNSKSYKKTTGIKYNLREVKEAIAPGAIGTFITVNKTIKDSDLEERYGVKPKREEYESIEFIL